MWVPGFAKRKLERRLKLKTDEGVTLRKQGDLRGSQELLARTAKTCVMWLGIEHADTLDAMSELGQTCRGLHDSGRSVVLHEQVLQIKRLRSNTSEIADSTIILADSLLLAGRRVDANSLLRRAIDECGAKRLIDAALDKSEGGAVCELGVVFRDSGDFDHSAFLYEDLCQGRTYSFLTDAQKTESTIVLADSLVMAGRTTQAEQILRRAIEGGAIAGVAAAALDRHADRAARRLVALHNPHRQSQWDKPAVTEWLKSLSDRDGKSAIVLADRLLRDGKADEAHILLRHAIAEFPEISWMRAAVNHSEGPSACALVALQEPKQSQLDKAAAIEWLRARIKSSEPMRDHGMLGQA